MTIMMTIGAAKYHSLMKKFEIAFMRHPAGFDVLY